MNKLHTIFIIDLPHVKFVMLLKNQLWNKGKIDLSLNPKLKVITKVGPIGPKDVTNFDSTLKTNKFQFLKIFPRPKTNFFHFTKNFKPKRPMVHGKTKTKQHYRSGKGIHPQAPRIINFRSFEVSLRQFRI
jgi:hypothetical protein